MPSYCCCCLELASMGPSDLQTKRPSCEHRMLADLCRRRNAEHPENIQTVAFLKLAKEKRFTFPPFLYINCAAEDPWRKEHNHADRFHFKSMAMNLKRALKAAWPSGWTPQAIHIPTFPDVCLPRSPLPSNLRHLLLHPHFQLMTFLLLCDNKAIQRESL